MWVDLRSVKYALMVLALTHLVLKGVIYVRGELVVAGNAGLMSLIPQKNVEDLVGVAYVFLVLEDNPHQNNRAYSRGLIVSGRRWIAP